MKIKYKSGLLLPFPDFGRTIPFLVCFEFKNPHCIV